LSLQFAWFKYLIFAQISDYIFVVLQSVLPLANEKSLLLGMDGGKSLFVSPAYFQSAVTSLLNACKYAMSLLTVKKEFFPLETVLIVIGNGSQYTW